MLRVDELRVFDRVVVFTATGGLPLLLGVVASLFFLSLLDDVLRRMLCACAVSRFIKDVLLPPSADDVVIDAAAAVGYVRAADTSLGAAFLRMTPRSRT